jgi:hypothetical protein
MPQSCHGQYQIGVYLLLQQYINDAAPTADATAHGSCTTVRNSLLLQLP